MVARRSLLRMAGLFTAAALSFGPDGAAAQPASPPLLRNPSLGGAEIAFLHADDIWTVPRRGGAARRVTTGGKVRGGPVLSPDGRLIAFTAASGGSTDIFVVATEGGEPRRVTWHPDAETLVGWTPDGRAVVFASRRQGALNGALRLFRARIDGTGTPEALPLPTGAAASFSPDGGRVAYTPFASRGWKDYRGGRAPYIWLVDLKTLDKTAIPHTGASDWNPMWIGDKVYFLSDRDGPVTLYAYDVGRRTVTRLIDNKGFDFMSAQAGPGGIVIDALDGVEIFDPASGAVRRVRVRTPPTAGLGRRHVDLPGSRAIARVLSPDGAAYAVEARGDIFVIPNVQGAVARNLSDSPAVADREPIWSPDGQRIAYQSDASGEYRLVVRAADGSGPVRDLRLGLGHGVFSDFHWSPDGRRMAYADERATTWVLDLQTGKSVELATDPEGDWPEPGAWSRDGRRFAFTRRAKDHQRAVCVWSADTGQITQVTDGQMDTYGPVFGETSDRLYFLASGDRQIATISTTGAGRMGWTAAAYAADLSQLGKNAGIIRVDAPEHDYRGLVTGPDGALYLLQGLAGQDGDVWRLTGPSAKAELFLDRVEGFGLVADGKVAVLRRGGADALIPLAGIKPASPTEPAIIPAGRTFSVPSLPMTVDPKAEWRQIYHEGWRLQRDLFYSAGYNGLDLAKAEARYAPFVEGLSSRRELTYLMNVMFMNLRSSHQGVSDPPSSDPAFGDAPPRHEEKPAGLLGADFEAADGRYRFQRIYRGDVWQANDVGPLGQPGVAVKAGDYLIGVDGHEVRAGDNLDRAFGAAGVPLALTVADDAAGANPRTYKVTPVANELKLRQAAWVEDNRRTVNRLSGGKLGYIYLPSTGDDAYNAFNREYLAQLDKRGLVIDERNNSGGPVPEYFIDRLNRARTLLSTNRYNPAGRIRPNNWIDGPSAMIVNESAGSGGDMLPNMYQMTKLGPVVGTRTWGGTIGSTLVPVLLDGGTMAVPYFANSDPKTGTWGGLEGSGVHPDIPVEMDPKTVMSGHDPQLEAAVRAVLAELAAHPRPAPIAPPETRAASTAR
jgi:tricorn protease